MSAAPVGINKSMKKLLIGFAAVALACGTTVFSCRTAANHATAPVPVFESPKSTLIRVNVTRQGYNFHQPWEQLQPLTQTAIGVVIEGPRVLVTGSLLANHRYIELEKIDTSEKSTAELEQVDYEANLALLKPKNISFLSGMAPLHVASSAVQGDILEIWQTKPNGDIIAGRAEITAVELAPYSYRNQFLVFRLNGSLQYQSTNVTMPALKDSRLAGLVKHYDAKRQTIDVIPAPIIDHFLKDAADGVYLGFPRVGMRISPMEDPQLRRYAGIPDRIGGVYVEGLTRNSAAEKAGIREGDVIFQIADHAVDRHGDYIHPLYHRVSVVHLIRCGFQVGERIQYHVYRSGQILTMEVVTDHQASESLLVPPYIIDRPPAYYILGGLVLQELSVNYLQEYGNSWPVKAPIELVYYEKNQDVLEPDGRDKIVVLSSALPSSLTIGYENLSDLVVTRVNGRLIRSLADIPEALLRPAGGFHKIEFEQLPKIIYLDPKEIPAIDEEIKNRYHLQILNNLN